MKLRNLGLFVIAAAMSFFVSCGGGSSSGVSTPGAVEGAGEASLDSLKSIPSLDLSEYDSSGSGSSNLAVPPKSLAKSVAKAVSKSVAKEFGEDMNAVGGTSRAGCEANMHKKEIFRMSQQTQLSRCYPEAMETAGFITIPNDSYAYYRIAPPEMDESEKGNMCEGIPPEMTEEIAKCQSEMNSKDDKVMLMRIGRMSGALHVDMCEGPEGAQVLMDESTYSADGSIYTVGVVHMGTWNGSEEKGKFDIVLDLGAAGKIENGVATLGSDSSLSAEGYMSGGFGSGHIKFEYVGTDASNKITGGFAGSFTDPSTNTVSSFTGKTYSHFGGSSGEGCAKYTFTGSPPGMSAMMMKPYDISADQGAEFFDSLSAELGFTVDSDTILCPNPNFDPNDFNPAIKPMIGTVNGACPSVTNTGVECFSISNVASTGDMGGTTYTQLFTIIANATAPFYTEVNAYDMAGVSSDAGTIAYSRNWDCSGSFTTVDFQNMTQEQGALAETAISACKAIEEKARENNGMGGYDCHQQEQGNAVNELANEGGGVEKFGKYGGKYVLTNGCEGAPAPIPSMVYFNEFNSEQNIYCVPNAGECINVTITGLDNAVEIPVGMGDVTITNILYDPVDPPRFADMTWEYTGGSCIATYAIERPEFQREGTGFVDQANCTGEQCQQGMPQACLNNNLSDPAACNQFCSQTSNPCGYQ